MNNSYKDDSSIITLTVKNNNPFINKILLDGKTDKVFLVLHNDIVKFKNKLTLQSSDAFNQLLINELAKINRQCDANISTQGTAL